jgi:hypothetical protein
MNSWAKAWTAAVVGVALVSAAHAAPQTATFESDVSTGSNSG